MTERMVFQEANRGAVSMRPAAAEDRAVLENLAQLYTYDWSEMSHFDIGENGRFEDMALAPYWTDDWRHPFLLRVGDRLAGFALILERSRLTGAPGVFDMAEFFVLRKFRRQGVGLQAAFTAFDRFKGRWEVRQRDENAAATAFWRRAIGEYTRGNYQEVRWNSPKWTGLVQTFSTG
jgi:predicted acetyltransferase